MLRQRLLTAPMADPELVLGVRDPAGGLLGLAAGVFIPEHSRFAGVRWLALAPALDPAREGREVVRLLLDELCRRLARRGVAKVRMMGTPLITFVPPARSAGWGR